MNRRFHLVVIISLFANLCNSQASFTINPQVCLHSTVQASATGGTLTSPSYSWQASSANVTILNPSTSSPTFSFNAIGNYTLTLSVSSGTNSSTSQQTIDVLQLPILILNKSPNAVCAGYNTTITAFGASSYLWTGSTFTGAILQQSISVSHGTYTLTASNSQGCISKDSLIVIPLAPPLLIGFSPTSATTCITSNSTSLTFLNFKPVSLIATGATNYEWFGATGLIGSSGPIIVNPTVATQYTVIGSTSSCSGTAVLNVTVNPQFTVGISISQQTICVGESITLSAAQIGSPSTNPFTYNWHEENNQITLLNGSVGMAVMAWPTSKRTYSLTVIDANDCVSIPASASIEVSLCTSINELHLSELVVFPNPFNDELFIGGDYTKIELKDELGRLILSKENLDNSLHEKLDTSDVLAGIYFIHLKSDSNYNKVIKLIKP